MVNILILTPKTQEHPNIIFFPFLVNQIELVNEIEIASFVKTSLIFLLEISVILFKIHVLKFNVAFVFNCI